MLPPEKKKKQKEKERDGRENLYRREDLRTKSEGVKRPPRGGMVLLVSSNSWQGGEKKAKVKVRR